MSKRLLHRKLKEVTTMPNDKDIMTINEAAKYLRMHPQTLRDKASTGEIPGKKIAKRWLFSKCKLQEWFRAENQDHAKPDGELK